MKKALVVPFLAALLAAGTSAAAQTEPEFVIVIENHRFTPSEITVPAAQKIKLVVDNRDKTAEEFESKSLKREKVIPGGTKATIVIGPLKPGSYEFVGEYNEKTARGRIVAK